MDDCHIAKLGSRVARTVQAETPEVLPNPRYHLLDVWRGIACLMVVVHHAAYALDWDDGAGTGLGAWLCWLTVYATRRMKLGVAIFFVISGYCIAASADASRRRGASPWAFLGRRVWRIYPPYWAALLGFALVVSAVDAAGLDWLRRGPRAMELDAPGALSRSQWIGNLTLTETLRERLGGPERNVYTGVAWSLCFEEQFYFACFLALLFAPRRLVPALVAITALVLAVRIPAWWAGNLWGLRGILPLLWHQFAVGLAVYYRLNLARGRTTRSLIDAGLLAVAVIGIATGGRDTAAAALFGLALIALRRWDARAEGLAWLAPLRACGRRSYSIYLAHVPVVVVGGRWLTELGLSSFGARAFVLVPLVSAASVAASWAFFELVEARFLNPPAFAPGRIRRSSGRARPLLAGEAAVGKS